MKNEEKTLSSEIIYDGKVVHLRKDKVLCPNGKEAMREIVDRQGAVGILAFLEGKIALGHRMGILGCSTAEMKMSLSC